MDHSKVPGPNVDEIDKKVWALHNEIRQNPKVLIPDLQHMLEQFDGMLLKRQGKVTLRTKEGKDAVQEAIDFLKIQPPVDVLRWNEHVYKACVDHLQDIGPKGLIQHDSSDGKTGVKERMRKYGNVVSCYGENLSFHCDEAKDVLMQLIIDDGVPNRGHRENIFNPEFHDMASCSGPHKDFSSMTVIDYAGAFVASGETDPIEKQMDLFLKEDVDFPDMPKDVRSWK